MFPFKRKKKDQQPVATASTPKADNLPILRVDPILTEKEALDLMRDADPYGYDGGVTISSQLGSSDRPARTRAAIFDKWSQMESDPFISRALRINCMAALMGDPETGSAIYIELKPEFKGNTDAENLVAELKDCIAPLLNRHAFTMVYNGLWAGDSYSRNYADKKRGVYDIYTEEQVRPPLILPFEQASRTIGYVVYSGQKPVDRLTMFQMSRLKMPRTSYIPQISVVEKSYKMSLSEDDPTKVGALPALIGGSILYNAEEMWDNLRKALLSLVGQRWIDSIDEKLLTLQMRGMSKDQQKRFISSVKTMLGRSKQLADQAVRDHKPVLERVTHIIPTFDDKQLTQVAGSMGSGRTSNMSIDDILFYAKATVGTLGADLSLVGFADSMSGGLGEGGFLRTSIQSAENATNSIRALTDYGHSIIDLHTYYKHGFVQAEKDKPYKIRFFGSIMAADNERQNTRLQAMQAGSMVAATVQQLKDMGANPDQAELFLSRQMLLDDDEASKYAAILNQPSSTQGAE